jgi:hypothetical protein
MKQKKGTAGGKSSDAIIIPEKRRLRRSAIIPAPAGLLLSLKSLIILFRSVNDELTGKV